MTSTLLFSPSRCTHMEASPSPLSSGAQSRDLQFRGPFLGFSTERSRACSERSRMGIYSSAGASGKCFFYRAGRRIGKGRRGTAIYIKPNRSSVVAERVNHLFDDLSLLINRAGISALVHYPVLVIVVEKEQVLLPACRLTPSSVCSLKMVISPDCLPLTF